MASAEQRRTFVPTVRVATVKATGGELTVSLPATTSAFAAANIFARASGYIATRSVDIGDRVKAGELLATIVAPELDHQISQAEATLAQLEAAATAGPRQPEARERHLAARRAAGQGRLAAQAAGHGRRADPARQRRCGERRRGQCRGPAGAAAGAAAAEGLSARGGAVRRRHHPAQHRHRQPGPGRRRQQHLHVHHPAEQRRAHAGLRAAGCRRAAWHPASTR